MKKVSKIAVFALILSLVCLVIVLISYKATSTTLIEKDGEVYYRKNGKLESLVSVKDILTNNPNVSIENKEIVFSIVDDYIVWNYKDENKQTKLVSLKSLVGEQGVSGIDGKDGKDGIDGKSGKDGVNGVDGVDGKDGKDGVTGKSTYLWIKYLDNEPSFSTDDNLKDTTGDYMGVYYGEESTAPTSISSYTWSKIVGSDGIQGLQGEKGDKGDTGEQGIQGEKGDKGDTGEQGIQGEKGDTGEQGIQGEKGDTGEQGIQGEKGDKGDKGDSGVIGYYGFVDAYKTDFADSRLESATNVMQSGNYVSYSNGVYTFKANHTYYITITLKASFKSDSNRILELREKRPQQNLESILIDESSSINGGYATYTVTSMFSASDRINTLEFYLKDHTLRSIGYKINILVLS